MNSAVDFDVLVTNKLIKEGKRWTIYTGDLFIEVKACDQPYFLNNLKQKMKHQCTTDHSEQLL